LVLTLSWLSAASAQQEPVTFQNQAFEGRSTVVTTSGEFSRIYDPSVQGEEPLKKDWRVPGTSTTAPSSDRLYEELNQ
jgi:hypothetical protein